MKTQSARLDGLGTTIFAEMSALALRTGSVNLGQGFPDTDGPASIVEAAVNAMHRGRNQYAPGVGVPELREALEATRDLNFESELIVVDNHSTDQTTAMLRDVQDSRLVHIIPQRRDLGIGGCWNEGIHHLQCGRFAVQLDSDDLYSDESTLRRIVATSWA